MTNNKTEGVGEKRDFLPVLIENYEAAKQGYKKYHDDPLDKIKYKAIVDEYEDLIAIYKNRQPSPLADVEQRAKEYYWNKHKEAFAENSRPDLIIGFVDGFIAGSESQGQQAGWVSVKDRLPENDENRCCMVCYNQTLSEAVVGIGRAWAWFVDDATDAVGNKISYFKEYYGDDLISNVTHWMPLPPPPTSPK